ncbi:MAG: fatty acid desaturase [Gemmatimonadota bacterium]|nr:fatty acid desaturase [Gemmatimonadota bacterium]
MAIRGSGATLAIGARTVEPSTSNALPHFVPLIVFPLVISAMTYGDWWIAGPVVFFLLADRFDRLFGLEERNMDLATTHESQLFLYKLSLWLWAALWPATFVFSLWQMLVADRLAVWEVMVMAGILAGVGQTVFVVGHELVHRRAPWERRLGEFLLASASYPHYSTEHVYIHHPHVCTPGDPGSAPKGLSFWAYLPRELASNVRGAWRFERNRLARRHLRAWHYTNAFWRYAAELAFWYGLIFWMGGPWAVLVFAVLCGSVVFSMKVSNYVQHYGLRRVRKPNGRFEAVKPRHAWSAAYKYTNWLYYNMQRHADHHTSNRRYPLLQHHGEADSPQLPGSYIQMNGMALFPTQWFETMDPLVDRQRAQFYPEIDDWSAYDSRAFAARPDAFEAIAEIHATAPRLASWINHSPELLDRLRDREFTDLELADGFGPDPEFEAIARRGLARVYWTHELNVPEMKAQLADIPTQDTREAVEVALEWSNGKVLQIALHAVRGSLSPVEAGTALSRVAEASVATVLSAVEEDFADRGIPRTNGGVAVVACGPLASAAAMPDVGLDVRFVYDGGPAEYWEALCRRFHKALRALSRGNLLLARVPRGGTGELVALDALVEQHRDPGSSRELLAPMRARCVFVSGDSETGARVEQALRDALSKGRAREVLLAELREATANMVQPDIASVANMRGGLEDIERAALYLRLTFGADAPELLDCDVASVFRTVGRRGLMADGAAERLAEAATLWRNLHGSLQLVLEDGFAVDSAPTKVKAVVARACGLDDFGALAGLVRNTASRAAADIDALVDN